MCGVIIDALILIALLQVVDNEEVDFWSAFFVALGASIVTGLLAVGLISVMGIAGFFVATLIGAAGVGVAVSAIFGVEIKKAFLIGAIFSVARIAVYFLLSMMFSA